MKGNQGLDYRFIIMKTTTYLIVLLFGIFLGIQTVHAQWVQANGPYGGIITAMTAYSNGKGGTNIMAGTSGGVFLSTDSGVSWTSVTNFGITVPPPVSFLKTVPDGAGGTYVYAGLGGYGFGGLGIYRSDNNGSSWTDIGLDYAGPQAFAVDTTGSGNTILIAGTGLGVYISTDNAAKWTKKDNGLTSTDVKALAVASDGSGTNYLFAGTNGGGIFVSTDSGASWEATNTGLTNKQISAIAIIPGSSGGATILAGTQYGGVFLSNNYGSSWTAATNSPSYATSFTIATDGSGNMSIFAGSSGNGMYRSDDGGSSWSKVNNGFSVYATYISSEVVLNNGTNNTRIFAGSSDGPYRSDDNGSNWTESDAGITANSINALAVATSETGATTIFAGGAGIYRSTDNGADWGRVNNDNITTMAVSPDGKGGNYIYAGTNGDGVIRSDDNGTTWTPTNKGLTDQNVSFMMADDSVVIVATDYQGIFISGDHGDNWSEGIYKKNDCCYSIDPKVWQKYWKYLVNHFPQKLLTLAMNDTSWASISDGVPLYDDIYSITAMSDSILFAVTNSYGIYRLMGNDTTWTEVNNGLTDATDKEINSLISYGESALFTATSGGVFASTNVASDWKSVNTGLGNAYTIQSLAASTKASTDGAELFAGTWGSGVWKRPISEMVTAVKKTQTTAPISFKLGQNYPNPFNPTTTIRYQLSQPAFVQLSIYNVLGQKVSELVNAQQQVGPHSVTFDASHLSSGVYFYRLKVESRSGGRFSSIKKMLLIK